MRNVFLWCTTLLVCLLVSGGVAIGQTTATFTMTFPTPASDGANLTTNIVLTSSVVLDTSSIEFDPGDKDSITFDVPPSVIVYPTDYFVDATEGTKRMLGQHGDLSIDATGKILTISNLSLRYGTNYTVETFGIEPENKIAYNVDQIQSTFNTVQLPHSVVLTSINGRVGIPCDETIRVLFNRKITSASTSLGPILTFSRLDSVDVSTTNNIRYETTIASVCQISLDNENMLELRSSNLVPGETYYVNVNTSYLNGDTDSDRTYAVKVKSHYTVSLEAELTDGSVLKSPLDSYVDLDERTYKYDQNVQITVPYFVEGYKFVEWKSTTNTQYHAVTTPSIQVSSACEDMMDYSLVAVYEKVTFCTLTLGGADGVAIDVLNERGERLGGPGTYKLYPVTGHGVTIRATSVGSDFEFSSWSLGMSSPPIWWQSTSNVVNLGPSKILELLGPVELDPVSDPKDPDPGNYSLCGEIQYFDGADASVFQWDTDQCDEDTQERDGTIAISILDDCYQITEIFDGQTWQVLDNYTESASITAPLTENGNGVTFRIEKKQYHVRVEYRLVENSVSTKEVGGNPLLGSNVILKVERDGSLVDVSTISGSSGTDPEGKPYIDYLLMCGDEVTLTATVEDDYEDYHYFQKWRLITGYMTPSQQSSPVNSFVLDGTFANFTHGQTGLKEYRTRANYFDVFRLEQVGLTVLKTNGNWEFEWFPVADIEDLLEDEPIDGRQVKYDHGRGAEVHFKFNMPVKQSTFTDPWTRIIANQLNVETYQHFNHDGQSSYYPSGSNISFYSDGNPNANVAKIYLRGDDQTKWASKMSRLDIVVHSPIESLSGLNLDTKYSIPIEIQMPNVGIKLESMKCVITDEDPTFVWGPGDMYQLFFSGILGPDELGEGLLTTNADWEGAIPECLTNDCADAVYELSEGETKDYNDYPLFSSGRQLYHYDYTFLRLQTLDADDAELINEIGTFLVTISDALTDVAIPDVRLDDGDSNTPEPTEYDVAMNDAYRAIARAFIGAVGEYMENASNADDSIGHVTYLYNKEEFWGSRSSLLYYKDDNGEYVFKIVLY